MKTLVWAAVLVFSFQNRSVFANSYTCLELYQAENSIYRASQNGTSNDVDTISEHVSLSVSKAKLRSRKFVRSFDKRNLSGNILVAAKNYIKNPNKRTRGYDAISKLRNFYENVGGSKQYVNLFIENGKGNIIVNKDGNGDVLLKENRVNESLNLEAFAKMLIQLDQLKTISYDSNSNKNTFCKGFSYVDGVRRAVLRPYSKKRIISDAIQNGFLEANLK